MVASLRTHYMLMSEEQVRVACTELRGSAIPQDRSKAKWLAGKRVLITGASSGLGRDLALRLADHAAALVIVGRHLKPLHVLRGRLLRGKARPSVVVEKVDLSRAADAVRLNRRVVRTLGGIDVIVNCGADFFCGVDLLDTPETDFERLLKVNLTAPLRLCRLFVPKMIERRSGRVLNVISATNELCGFATFRVTKIGLEVVTQSLIEELRGSGVGVAAVNPGWMRTRHSHSGLPPEYAAEAIVDRLNSPSVRFDGKWFDLDARARPPKLRVRRRIPGLFGARAQSYVPVPVFD